MAIKNYNKLSDKYDVLFGSMVSQFKKTLKCTEYKNGKYAVYYPSFGIKKGEKCDFLVYGQVVNSNEVNINKSVPELIEFANEYYEAGGHTPLDWVNAWWNKSYFNKLSAEEKKWYGEILYSCSRSFFWNVIYKTINQYYDLNEESNEWTRHMVWSNLYKIAPLCANPDLREQEFQKDLALKLVKNELKELNPKFCLVLTNDTWWQPFRSHLKTKPVSNIYFNTSIIQSIEKHNQTLIVVTSRPYIGDSEKFAKEINKIIKLENLV